MVFLSLVGKGAVPTIVSEVLATYLPPYQQAMPGPVPWPVPGSAEVRKPKGQFACRAAVAAAAVVKILWHNCDFAFGIH